MNGASLEDFWQFIWPQAEQPLQTAFFIMIFGLAIGVAIWTILSANEKNWALYWQGGLTREHGSIHDLSDALASRAERICEILPGILLVLGLLGTFIGLGIALDQAAEVVQDGDIAASQAGLTAVIHGIGTKFRTSAWGILAYLILRSLIVAAGWDDKRLRWCIKKINAEAKARRRENEDFQTDLNRDLQTGMKENSSLVSTVVATELKKLQEALLPIFMRIEQHEETAQRALSEFVRTHVASMKSISDSAKGMRAASTTMSEAAQQVDASAGDLRAVVMNFGSQVETTLGNLQTELIDTIGNVDKSFDRNLKAMSDKIVASTNDISSTMAKLGDAVDTTMRDVNTTVTDVSSTIDNSVRLQAESLGEFRLAADQLNENALHMQTPIQDLKELLSDQFAQISKIGLQVVGLNKKSGDVVESNERVAGKLGNIFEKVDLNDWSTRGDLRKLETTIARCNDTMGKLLTLAKTLAATSDRPAPKRGAEREG